MNISEDDRKYVQEIIPESKDLFEADDVDEVLASISDWILMNGYAPEGEEQYVLTPLGRKAERIYDRIYYNN